MLNENELNSVQWRSIHSVSILEKPDFSLVDKKVIEISLTKDETDESFFDKIARAFNFPDWFGKNWDAFHDLLDDPDFLPDPRGYVLVLNCTDGFWSKNPLMIGKLIEVWLDSAESWSKENKSFHLVFVTN